MLKEYLEINVKNDEQLVKLATIVQRIATQTKTSNADDEFGISDKEKEQLLASIQEVSNEVQDYSDKIISSRDE
jgi:hypothetical protein